MVIRYLTLLAVALVPGLGLGAVVWLHWSRLRRVAAAALPLICTAAVTLAVIYGSLRLALATWAVLQLFLVLLTVRRL